MEQGLPENPSLRPPEPPVARPFDKQPADLGGCGKPAVVGCLIVLILVAVGFVYFLSRAMDLLSWGLVQYQKDVIESVAEDVPADEVARLERAFEAARAAIESREIKPEALQRLQRFMASPRKKGEKVGVETVRELTTILEEVGNVASLPGLEPDPVSPAPAAADGTSASV